MSWLIPPLACILGGWSLWLWVWVARQRRLPFHSPDTLPVLLDEPVQGSGPPSWPPWVMLAAYGVWLLLGLAQGLIRSQAAGEPHKLSIRDVQLLCGWQVLTLAGIALVLRLAGPLRARDFGLSRSEWKENVRAGVAGLGLSLAPVYAVAGLLSPWRTESHELLDFLRQNLNAGGVGWTILSAVVLAPAVEELLYRVVLQGTLERLMRPTTAILVVALAFAGIHRLDSLPLIPLALILGLLYHARRSYLAVYVMHALFNGLNLLLTGLAV